ncbi:hypothetical protein J6D24_03150 [Candidatus Saccharibacteria bacterium]|nr:hypothetical protein [Candidatus Saccharibacteria bacterium]
MPKKPAKKMPVSERAKQFLPFAALNGLDAALRQKEWEVESRQKLENPRITRNIS